MLGFVITVICKTNNWYNYYKTSGLTVTLIWAEKGCFWPYFRPFSAPTGSPPHLHGRNLDILSKAIAVTVSKSNFLLD